MRRPIVVMSMLVVLAGVSCGDHNPECPELGSEYPTTVGRLDDVTLETLRGVYSAQNPRICSTLNEYGFTTGALCMSYGVGLPEDLDVAAMIVRAKAAIAANAQYTGVSDTSALSVISHDVIPQRWFMRINFARQVYAGLEVLAHPISVLMDSLGVFWIDGNYYPEISVPAEPVVSATQAQVGILGMDITFEDFGGDPHTFVIGADSFRGEPVERILEHAAGDAIELRVAWRIPVGPAGGEPAWWFVYVDVMDGEMLLIDQLIMF